jgi:hypothetical protein
MADQERIDCPVCAKDVTVVKAGTIRAHRYGGTRCPASQITPEAAKALGVTMVEDAPEPEPAALVPEVIAPQAQTGTALEPARPASAAIEAAAEAALANPGVPGRDEFLALAAQARILCMSGAAPEAVRNDPHLAFHLALVGRDLGISPSSALELIDVISTKNGYRLSMSPQLMNGQLRRLGLGSVKPLMRTKDTAIAAAYGPDGELLGETEFTWEDAVTAELVDTRCAPGQHWRNGQTKCACRPGWRTYPKRMLWWRAAGFAADDYFPEASLGLYSPEELGAAVDDEGRPLDPATIALPAGYEPMPGNGHARGVPPVEQADGADLWQLQARCWALPPEQKATLRQQRQGNEKLRAGAQGGVIPTHQLPVPAFRVMKALVSGLEGAAARADDSWVAAEQLESVNRHWQTVLLTAFLTALNPWTGAGAPEDPGAAGGQETATQAPIPPDPDDIDGQLEAIEREVAGLSDSEVSQVLTAAAVRTGQEIPTDASPEALRELLAQLIAENRGVGA